jgi:CRP-like cAMP-binding protein
MSKTMPCKRLPAPLDTLSAAECQILAPHLEPVIFPAGTCLFRAGEVGDTCYVVDTGTVRIELGNGGTPAPDDTVLGFFGPGSVVGEMSVLDRLPRSATAYAHTNVAARRIRIEDVKALARSSPEVALRLIAALGRGASLKARAINDRFADLLVPQVDPVVEELIARALAAQRSIEGWTEARIDRLLLALAQTVADHAEELAVAAVEETGIGNVRDKTLLAIDGRGHTAIIHALDAELIERFAAEMPASRILVNSPGTQGVLGLTIGLVPSMTLGCGTFGGTSTTDNVTYTHLLNIKRIAYYTPERAGSETVGADAARPSIPLAEAASALRG